MDLLIIVKWMTDFSVIDGAKPASIISTMIVMCLNFGVPPEDPNQKESPIINYQTQVMQIIMVLSLISVPIMLFVKPIYENSKNKHHHKQVEENLKEEIHHHEGEQYYAINNEEGEHVAKSNHSSPE